MFFETLKLALQAIRRNALRSFLTLLGIVIGVGAVIAMVTIGNGTTAKVTADMAKLGSNLLFVRPGQFGPGRSSATARPFNARDVVALREQLLGVKAVAPVARSTTTIVYGSENRSVQVAGTDNDYFITQDLGLKEGRQFLEGELRSGRAACLIGETVREELFGSTSPLGPKDPREQGLVRGRRPLGGKRRVQLRHGPGRYCSFAGCARTTDGLRATRISASYTFQQKMMQTRRRCRPMLNVFCASAATSRLERRTTSLSPT